MLEVMLELKCQGSRTHIVDVRVFGGLALRVACCRGHADCAALLLAMPGECAPDIGHGAHAGSRAACKPRCMHVELPMLLLSVLFPVQEQLSLGLLSAIQGVRSAPIAHVLLAADCYSPTVVAHLLFEARAYPLPHPASGQVPHLAWMLCPRCGGENGFRGACRRLVWI
mgnify:CR=1 FL=1